MQELRILAALISPEGEICADGMAFDEAKQLCCTSRRARAAGCFPAITTPQGKVLCPDWTTPDQAKQLCCEKNSRQAGSTGQTKGKNGR
ncbi:hypothetical protein AAVH_18304 [Aphelenchoides avenae]|nr:hypothetical protein AAVH_18304 [Aphelenchus avenae]